MFIGELGLRTGLKPKTIRFYEAVGLLPEPRRSEGGYRLYPPAAVERLRFIRTAQSLGLRLAEIKEIIRRGRSGPPCDYVAELTKEKIASLDAEVKKLGQTRQRLAELLTQLDENCCQPASPPLSVICPCIQTSAPSS